MIKSAHFAFAQPYSPPPPPPPPPQKMDNHHNDQHFLVVAFPSQGHINPALQLAKRLTTAGTRVTFSTTISAHRRMFPATPTSPVDDPQDPLLSFHPHSDAFDEGFSWTDGDRVGYLTQFNTVGARTLCDVAASLATSDRKVTCVIYSLISPWAASAATDIGVPSVVYWIQAATVFAIYYHYFHGYKAVLESHGQDPSFTVELPGVPPLQVRDLPSFLFPSEDETFLPPIKGIFEILDKAAVESGSSSKPKVLLNSFDVLEQEALDAIDKVELIPIGPMVPLACLDSGKEKSNIAVGDLIKAESREYLEWLDSRPEKSVVYVSFGSFSLFGKQQMEEISRALAKSGRPYLWVVRGMREGVVVEEAKEGKDRDGLVVDWCSQGEVLSHRSVGCFVTHCGWNSTLETLASGVPAVAFPQWTDQTTNARMMEEFWGMGVTAVVNEERVVEEGELRRCLDLVMGAGEKGVEIRRKAAMWGKKAREAMKEGGSSDLNLKAFFGSSGRCT